LLLSPQFDFSLDELSDYLDKVGVPTPSGVDVWEWGIMVHVWGWVWVGVGTRRRGVAEARSPRRV